MEPGFWRAEMRALSNRGWRSRFLKSNFPRCFTGATENYLNSPQRLNEQNRYAAVFLNPDDAFVWVPVTDMFPNFQQQSQCFYKSYTTQNRCGNKAQLWTSAPWHWKMTVFNLSCYLRSWACVWSWRCPCSLAPDINTWRMLGDQWDRNLSRLREPKEDSRKVVWTEHRDKLKGLLQEAAQLRGPGDSQWSIKCSHCKTGDSDLLPGVSG